MLTGQPGLPAHRGVDRRTVVEQPVWRTRASADEGPISLLLIRWKELDRLALSPRIEVVARVLINWLHGLVTTSTSRHPIWQEAGEWLRWILLELLGGFRLQINARRNFVATHLRQRLSTHEDHRKHEQRCNLLYLNHSWCDGARAAFGGLRRGYSYCRWDERQSAARSHRNEHDEQCGAGRRHNDCRGFREVTRRRECGEKLEVFTCNRKCLNNVKNEY